MMHHATIVVITVQYKPLAVIKYFKLNFLACMRSALYACQGHQIQCSFKGRLGAKFLLSAKIVENKSSVPAKGQPHINELTLI